MRRHIVVLPAGREKIRGTGCARNRRAAEEAGPQDRR